jgi:hypothetical protein
VKFDIAFFVRVVEGDEHASPFKTEKYIGSIAEARKEATRTAEAVGAAAFKVHHVEGDPSRSFADVITEEWNQVGETWTPFGKSNG